jgi:acyl dehydratase
MRLRVGQGRLLRCIFSQKGFDRIAALSGDDNPIHVNPKFAVRTRFRKTMAHGVLLYGVISKAIGELIPGAVVLEQESIHPYPTYGGEEVIVWVGVTSIQREQKLAELDTFVIRRDGAMGLKGKVIAHLPEEC